MEEIEIDIRDRIQKVRVWIILDVVIRKIKDYYKDILEPIRLIVDIKIEDEIEAVDLATATLINSLKDNVEVLVLT